jgi:branched-chain amino acid transport system ATP-binding protein
VAAAGARDRRRRPLRAPDRQRQLDLGYIAFFGTGAYGYALFASSALGSDGHGGLHLAAFESVPIVVIAAGVLGVAIGMISMRLDGDYLAIVTLFVGQAFMEAVNNADPGTFGGVDGLFGLDGFHGLNGEVTTPRGYFFLALILLAALTAILRLLDTSRTGRAWRALRDDPLAARAMTIPVNKLKVMAFAFAAMVGALAGTLFAAQQTSVFPTNFTENILILIYACLVLGGTGSIGGAILGGIVVTVVEQVLTSPTDSAYLFYGLLLLGLAWKIRPWRRLGTVLAGIVALGLAAHAIVGAISGSATAGAPGSGGWIGSLLGNYAIVPSSPASYGNVLFIVMICLVIALVRLEGVRRLALIPPTVYVAICCWEARLVVNPSITTQIMIGAILIVMMSVRPNGLIGVRRVEVVSFGGLKAISNLDLVVSEREIVSMIGPNGAGKTTVFNVITGIYRPSGGDVRLAGESIAGVRPDRITRRGIARTFQSLRLFLNMSVKENVKCATYGATRASPPESILRLPRARREEREVDLLAEQVLSFFGERLTGYRWEQPAYVLSYANRRRLEIARALATRPKLLLLDEPAAGMNPKETHEVTELIGRLRDELGLAILVIEHDMHVVEGISDRVVALDHGIKIAEGSYLSVATNPGVVESYLGRDPEALAEA